MTDEAGTHARMVETYPLGADGPFPGNPNCPLLVYRAALALAGDAAAECERLFARHGWSGGWRDGVYPYHHFHSNAHEALGFVAGSARVRFGGPNGPVVEVAAGDVVVIPAGVAHKKESATPDLLVIGAYAEGRGPDLRRGRPEERESVLRNVEQVPLPEADPVLGAAGPLRRRWRPQG
ncbi:MAG TPA: cupin domain-containing protein [Stellaceae bacterium]|nr:cupin domain-containing protein [Stellaceae bacterium]